MDYCRPDFFNTAVGVFLRYGQQLVLVNQDGGTPSFRNGNCPEHWNIFLHRERRPSKDFPLPCNGGSMPARMAHAGSKQEVLHGDEGGFIPCRQLHIEFVVLLVNMHAFST